MKKLIMLVAALLVSSSVMAATPLQPLQPVPNGSPLQFTGDLTFYGADTYRIEASTPAATPILMFAGKGFYYGMDCSSGTAGDFAQAFDSASTTSITLNTKAKAISGAVLTQANVVPASTVVSVWNIDGSTTTTITLAPLVASGKSAPVGKATRITAGLVVLKTGSGNANCLVSALSDATIAAQAH